MQAKKENQVIIRIWDYDLSRENKRVGHISIEIPKINKHMSLWPADLNFREIFTTTKAQFVASPEKDIEYESVDENGDFIGTVQTPSYIYCLYSLDIQAIEREFDATYNDEKDEAYKGWTLIGSVFREDRDSCASLAYKLLKEGGIYQLIPQVYSSSLSSAASPTALHLALESAKQEELKRYPDTEKFERYENESSITIQGESYNYTEQETTVQNSFFNRCINHCTENLGRYSLFAATATVVAGAMYLCPEGTSETLKSWITPSNYF